MLLGSALLCLGSWCGVAAAGAIEDLALPESYRLEASGTVVDELGRPMMAVEMTVIEHRADPEGGDWSTRRRTEIVDGAFAVVCDRCVDLDLRFVAPGYRPESVDLSLTDEEMALLLEAGPDAVPTLERHGVIVRLATPQPEARPIVVRGILDLTADGQVRVLAGAPRDAGEKAARLKATSAIAGAKLRAKHGGGLSLVRLEAPAGQLDELVRIARAGNAARAEAAKLEPLVVRFDLAGGGVIAADPGGTSLREQYRSLSRAPAEGYGDHLELSLADTQDLYFYCLVDGMYGKGRLAPVWEQPMGDQSALMTHVELYLNPTGSRDLRGMVP